MALTPSNMLPLGTPAPYFKLLDTISGEIKPLDDLKSDKATLIMFICNHCPFVKHVDEELVRLANDYQSKGVSFIGISSNDADKYPQDGPIQMKAEAEKQGYPFPYLYDETQDVAKAYEAACTPDFYIFDKDMKLAYRGQLDDARPSSATPLTGKDIRNALDVLLDGNTPSVPQKPSMGCNIKWK
ncbi:thioredoxin family protein [Limibacter armeniacum]|uniref:thioredoxin family protein n=1 Tax=Limibacter armeniacum TaxID=466084 RepID=UPI002FE555B7